MSDQESDISNFDEDFQIIDASYFQSDSQKQGLQFHLNLPCPICASFQSNFICQNCIKCGSFTHSRGSVTGSYSDLGKRLLAVNQEIRSLSEQLGKHRKQPRSTPLEELKLLAASLGSAIAFQTEENLRKRKGLDRLQRSINRCHTESHELRKRQTAVLNFVGSLRQRRLEKLKNLDSHDRLIERLRSSYLRELFHSHLAVNLSSDFSVPDTFAGAGLHLDRKHIFIGPEPLLSTHTALTYCVPAIRAAALFTDLWIPPSIQQHLQLAGSFLTGPPQRDNLGRVYSAVLHAVHMLCSSRSINVRSVLERVGRSLPANHSEYNPLLGLFCLALFTQCRHFDESYAHDLDGFFGDVLSPSLSYPRGSSSLRLEHVEPGEEAKELEESQCCDNPSSPVQQETINRRSVAQPTSATNSRVDSEAGLWEVVTNSQDPSSNFNRKC